MDDQDQDQMINTKKRQEEQRSFSRTWTHSAVKQLSLYLDVTKDRTLKKEEYLNHLFQEHSLYNLEQDLVCGTFGNPLRSATTTDYQRIQRHQKEQKIAEDFLSCFSTLVDGESCLRVIQHQSATFLPDCFYIKDMIAMACYMADMAPEKFLDIGKGSLAEVLNQEEGIVPLGVISDPEDPTMFIGVLTTVGILRVVPYRVPSHVPCLVGSATLCERLVQEEVGIALDMVPSILRKIRPYGMIVADHGSAALAVVWWSTVPTYLLEAMEYHLVKARTKFK